VRPGAAPPRRGLRRLLPLLLLAGVGGAFAVGRSVRDDLGIELSAESVRAAVLELGVVAPLAFVGLVVFRNFLFLPSLVLLTGGGLVFGLGLGTALGGLGVTASALMKYWVARAVGRGWIEDRMGPSYRELEARLTRSGPLLVGLVTAHPLGPMSAFHWGSGFAGIAAPAFGVAMLVAGPLRAFACSLLGSALLDMGSLESWLWMAAFLAVALLPLLHPELRRRLLPGRRQPAPSSGSGPA